MNTVELLVEGLGTTVIGMSIVFLTLICIAFVISLLKYIGGNPQKKQQTPEVVLTTPKKEEQTVEIKKEEDDLALVAAITAAVAATLGTSADKLKVVSIRKSATGSWTNAAKREQHRHIY